MLIGLVVCFLGRKLFTPILFLTGILLSVSLIWLIFYSISDSRKTWVGWVVLGVAVLVGIVLGWLFTKLTKLGAFCLAAWGGFSLGLLLYNSFLYTLHS